ncbi:MAG: ATP-binding protein [Lachnospiraceae bacterium]|nr:ATP-binding protein [Lachnospiraceae bacterium]
MENLILFRNLKHEDILRDVCALETGKPGSGEELKSSVTARLIDLAVRYGFEGNLWHCFLAYTLINNENPFTLTAERKGEVGGTLEKTALHDVRLFRKYFTYDRDFVPDYILNYEVHHSGNEGETFNKRIRDRIVSLAERLAAADSDEAFLKEMMGYYRDFGVGKYGQHKAFRIKNRTEGDMEIEPITRVKHVYLDDIVGMELQKKKLIDNTEAFLEGRPANNVLLFGDAGTGKSSCVKGILNRYFDRGLRMIEVFKHQFRDLNDVVKEIKNRNYRFIIYMDDLSFEDSEVEYKYLKAVIEGGLEKKPDNILIYATSNRRHLIHEGFSDKLDRGITDDIHESDTVQEKLSLSARFGEKIYFGRPGKKEFDHIVLELAHRRGISMSDEELKAEANKWELSHGGMSGRTAEQFVDYLEGVETPQRSPSVTASSQGEA